MMVYSVATVEVQDGCTLCEADAYSEWDEAVNAADSFMVRCVGDFFEIDPSDLEGRRGRLEERVYRGTSVWRGKRKLEVKYECEGLALAATIQEVEL